MNPVEKRLAEQIGALLIDNAKLATTVEMQAAEIKSAHEAIARLTEEMAAKVASKPVAEEPSIRAIAQNQARPANGYLGHLEASAPTE